MQQFGTNHIALQNLLADAVIAIPVGFAEQDFAIAAIWILGKLHEILRNTAIQVLESISTFKKEIAEKYLIDF